jgi:hypothetical protein
MEKMHDGTIQRTQLMEKMHEGTIQRTHLVEKKKQDGRGRQCPKNLTKSDQVVSEAKKEHKKNGITSTSLVV